jgi:hypothetical protein
MFEFKTLRAGTMALVGLLAANAAHAVTPIYTLTNTYTFADGYAVAGPTGYDFTVYGSDNGRSTGFFVSVLTSYTTVATRAQIIQGNYRYQTFDGSQQAPKYDTAGFIINGARTQLSSNLGQNTQPGSFAFNVGAGDLYGFYVLTADNYQGRGSLAIDVIASVPEPTSWAMLIVGFGLTGAVLRRRTTAARAA